MSTTQQTASWSPQLSLGLSTSTTQQTASWSPQLSLGLSTPTTQQTASLSPQLSLGLSTPTTQQTARQKHITSHTQSLNGLCPGLFGYAGTRRNIHPLTPILIIGHPLSTSSIYYDPQQSLWSVYVLDNPFPQPPSIFHQHI